MTLSEQVRDALEVLGRGAADHADDLVALVEQELGQVRAVLPVMPVISALCFSLDAGEASQCQRPFGRLSGPLGRGLPEAW